jgi:hypothetical protein
VSTLRRYEILVPLLAQTFVELRERFGSASWETQILRGTWEQEGTLYEDNLTRFFVDVPDVPEYREFFKGFKVILKKRFDQLDVWITSHPIDVI